MVHLDSMWKCSASPLIISFFDIHIILSFWHWKLEMRMIMKCQKGPSTFIMILNPPPAIVDKIRETQAACHPRHTKHRQAPLFRHSARISRPRQCTMSEFFSLVPPSFIHSMYVPCSYSQRGVNGNTNRHSAVTCYESNLRTAAANKFPINFQDLPDFLSDSLFFLWILSLCDFFLLWALSFCSRLLLWLHTSSYRASVIPE